MSFLPVLIFLLLSIASAGVALLVHSIRGKVVPNSNHCRACRFDLSGLKAAPSCPECGASLADPSAIVPRRIRSRGLILLGAVLTAIPLSIGAGALGGAAAKFNFDSIKPVWILKSDALQGTPTRSAAALTELNKRIRAGSLSENQFASLATTAITLRRTPSGPWNRGWSEIVEFARAKGKVTDAEWTDFVRSSIVPIDRHRRKMRQGEKAPFNLSVTGPQLGSSPPAGGQVAIRYGLVRGTLDNKEFFRSEPLSATTHLSGNGTSGTGTQIAINASPGKAQMKLTFRFEALDPASDKAVGSWESDFTDEVEILPADATLVEAHDNPALAPAVRKTLRIAPIDVQPGGYLSLMVNADSPPANLAFDVFARFRSGPKSGTTVPIGQISFVQGSTSGYGIGTDSTTIDADSVDLILRPSVRAAELNADLDWVWTGPDIVCEDIKIKPKPR